MTPDTFFYVLVFFAFLVGAVIGSFLNVVIYRVPAGLSVVHPGSRCPHCKTPIRWYDNIPIVSWIILGAQCRACDAPIPSRYAIVEGLTGLLSAALWIKIAGPHFQMIGRERLPDMPPPVPDATALPWGSLGLLFGFYFFFVALLVVITFVDLDHYLIPHKFTLPGMAVGIVAVVVLNSELMATGSTVGFWPPVTVAASLIGLVAGGLAVVLVFYLYFAARGIEGVGGGDVTMMALTGAWLGWPALIFIFFAASIQGLIAAALGSVFGAGFLKDSEEIMAMDDPSQGGTDGDAMDDEAQADEEAQRPGEVQADEAVEADAEVPAETEVVKEDAGDEEESDDEDWADDEELPAGALAVPFGPFIALAAVEYLFFGEFLPDWLSMAYLYYGL